MRGIGAWRVTEAAFILLWGMRGRGWVRTMGGKHTDLAVMIDRALIATKAEHGGDERKTWRGKCRQG
jgi:hypothetical protein